MTRKHRHVAPVTLVVADCQNVGNLFKYRHAVATFVRQFGPKMRLQAYHYWRNFPALKEQQLLADGWNCIDVPNQAPQALDQQLIQDCREWSQLLPIKTLVLIAGDRDFVPLIQEFQHQGVKVIALQIPHFTACRDRRLRHHHFVTFEGIHQHIMGFGILKVMGFGILEVAEGNRSTEAHQRLS